MDVKSIAKVAHEANKSFCEAIGDNSQVSWEDAPQWQRDSAIAGIQFRIANPNEPVSLQHAQWCAEKVCDGWTYGPEKDPEKKTHPCLVPFDRLPEEQQRKDYLFVAVVAALTHEMKSGE